MCVMWIGKCLQAPSVWCYWRFFFALSVFCLFTWGVIKDVQALYFCSQYALKTIELSRQTYIASSFLLLLLLALTRCVISSKIQKQLRSKISIELLLLCQRWQEAENKLIFSFKLFIFDQCVTSLKPAKLLSNVSDFN